MKDAQIVQHLEEKLQVFAALTETVTGVDDAPYHRLLLRGTTADLQQGEQLLIGAIADGKTGWRIKFHWWLIPVYLLLSAMVCANVSGHFLTATLEAMVLTHN